MLLIQQRGNNSIQPDRLTLTGSTGHKHMRHLAQIHHKNFIGNGLAQCNRQIIRRLLKLLAANDALTRNNLRIGVRNLNTDCSLSWYRSNDTDAQCRQAQCNIILQTSYLRNTDALFRRYLIECHRRANRSLDSTDFNAKASQCIDNLIFVGILLRHINRGFGIVIMLHQVNCRIMVVLQVKTRVIRFYFRAMIFFIFHRLHFKRRLIPLLLSRCGSSRSDIGRRSFNRHGHFTLFGSRSFILWRTSQVEHYFMGIFFVIFFTGFFQVPGELFLLYTRKLFGLRRLFLPSHRPRVRKLLRCFA